MFVLRTFKRRILLQKYNTEDKEDTEALMQDIQNYVLKMGEKFNTIYLELHLELRKHNIEFIDQHKLNESQSAWVRSYFRERVLRLISPILLSK